MSRFRDEDISYELVCEAFRAGLPAIIPLLFARFRP